MLFSGEMVKAIIEGNKTQTRRIGKIQGNYVGLGVSLVGHATKGHEAIATHDAYPGRGTARHGIEYCRFGIPGDRLWVRETFAAPWGLDYKFPGGESGILYRADNPKKFPDDGTWKPSIFMPRKASRITLEITAIRVQRLQEISEDDAEAEGCSHDFLHSDTCANDNCALCGGVDDCEGVAVSAKENYRALWERINGKGSWDANPWVWVVAFKKVFNGELSDAAPKISKP